MYVILARLSFFLETALTPNIIQDFDCCKIINTESAGPVVQSIVSLTSSLRGQLVKCFMTL